MHNEMFHSLLLLHFRLLLLVSSVNVLNARYGDERRGSISMYNAFQTQLGTYVVRVRNNDSEA